MRIACVLGVVIWSSVTVAQADTAADVKSAFATYVDGVAKKQLGKVDLFVAPSAVETPVPDSLDETAAMLPGKQKITYLAVVPSPGGKSAWLAAELAANVKIEGKLKYKKLRASSMLVNDAGSWRVTAMQLSAEVKDQNPGMCGMFPGWNLGNKVPAALAPTVNALIAGIEDTANKHGKLRALHSDNKAALLLGSAPGEKWVGGAKIKTVYEKWPIHYGGDKGDENSDAEDDKLAASAPDGELMWAAIPVDVHKFCQTYRGFFVFAKEKAGWRIVHAHYATRINL